MMITRGPGGKRIPSFSEKTLKRKELCPGERQREEKRKTEWMIVLCARARVTMQARVILPKNAAARHRAQTKHTYRGSAFHDA